MTQFQIVLQGIFGDLLTILVIPVVLVIMVTVTIKEGRVKTTIMDDEDNELRVNLKGLCLSILLSAGLWLVLIAVGYVFIRWAGR